MYAWTRFERWLSEHAPELHADLRPPAPDDEIRAVERFIGRTLPDGVRELYRIHDGQSDDAPGIFFGLPFSPLHEVVAAWDSWRTIIDPGTNEELSEHCTSDPEGAIQCLYTCRGWIPLSDDSGGNHFGVDLEPGPRGERGQIINFGRDESDKYVLAPSIEDFLMKLGDLLDEGNFVLDEDGLSLASPRVTHLLDAASFLASREARRIH